MIARTTPAFVVAAFCAACALAACERPQSPAEAPGAARALSPEPAPGPRSAGAALDPARRGAPGEDQSVREVVAPVELPDAPSDPASRAPRKTDGADDLEHFVF